MIPQRERNREASEQSEPAGGKFCCVRANVAKHEAQRAAGEPAGGRLAFVRASDRKRGGRAAPPQTEAFTLMEAMIVIIIIAVSAGLAAPGLGNAMAERRTNQAALDVVRLVRHARSEASAYGRAHLVRIGETRIDVFRGINSGCNTNDWETILDAGECGEDGSMCVDAVDVSGSPYTMGDEEIAIAGSASAGTELCYEPLGVMRWRTSAEMRFTDRNSTDDADIGGGVRISFTRSDGGEEEGVVRWVVLPLSGDARVLR